MKLKSKKKTKKEKKLKKKRRGAPKGKGSGFEREICKRLSIWWTGDPEEDDAFWRSSNSGGRATIRGRKGKRTSGHAGDITNTDKRGAPLLKLFAMEVKRGYPKAVLHALLDQDPKAKQRPEWELWIKQARASMKLSGSLSWAIIAKRDRRETVIMIEGWIAQHLNIAGLIYPAMHLSYPLPEFKFGKKSPVWLNQGLFIVPFDKFLDIVEPIQIKQLAKEIKDRRERLEAASESQIIIH